MRKVLIYAFIAYLAIFVAGVIQSLPSRTTAGTFVATQTAPLPSWVIYSYIIFLILGGFAMGFFIRYHQKKGTFQKIKADSAKVFIISFILIFIFAISQFEGLFVKLLYFLFYPTVVIWLIALAFLMVLMAIAIKILVNYPGRNLKYFNIVGIFLGVLIAFNLGTFIPPFYAFVFLGALSIYDFIAVFITKHMQRIVQFVAPTIAVSTNPLQKAQPQKTLKTTPFIYPAFLFEGDMVYISNKISGSLLVCPNCKGLGERKMEEGEEITYDCKYCHRRVVGKKGEPTTSYKVIEKGDEIETVKLNADYQKEMADAPKTSLLGLGDIIIGGFPIVAVTIYQSATIGFAIALGAILGMTLNFLIVRIVKKGLPALPLLFFTELLIYLFAIRLV